MSKSFTSASKPGSTKGPSGGKISSPSSTPEEQQKTLGGMPPEKSIKEINSANDPAKRGRAPGAVSGI